MKVLYESYGDFYKFKIRGANNKQRNEILDWVYGTGKLTKRSILNSKNKNLLKENDTYFVSFTRQFNLMDVYLLRQADALKFRLIWQ